MEKPQKVGGVLQNILEHSDSFWVPFPNRKLHIIPFVLVNLRENGFLVYKEVFCINPLLHYNTFWRL